MLLTKMTKNTSIILIAAIAGIMVAGALAVAMPSAAFADQHSRDKDQHKKGDTATAGNGGIGGAGGAGGVAGNGGENEVEHAGGFNHQSANGGDANGGDGGDANGGNACNNECRANSD